MLRIKFTLSFHLPFLTYFYIFILISKSEFIYIKRCPVSVKGKSNNVGHVAYVVTDLVIARLT